MQCVVSGNVGACSEITNDMRRHRFVVRRTPTRTLHFSRFILSYGGPFLHVAKVSNDLASHREMKRACARENEPCRCVTANACLHKRVIKVPTIGKRAPLFSNRWKHGKSPTLIGTAAEWPRSPSNTHSTAGHNSSSSARWSGSRLALAAQPAPQPSERPVEGHNTRFVQADFE